MIFESSYFLHTLSVRLVVKLLNLIENMLKTSQEFNLAAFQLCLSRWAAREPCRIFDLLAQDHLQ